MKRQPLDGGGWTELDHDKASRWLLANGREPDQAWYDVPLPPCPDCGGDLKWAESGNVPGTRRCVGEPIGGRPTNPICDRRVPLIGESPADDDPRGGETPAICPAVRLRVLSLYAERCTCRAERVAEIDREILYLLRGYTALDYAMDGGCRSLARV